MKKWYRVTSRFVITGDSVTNYRYLEEDAEKYNTLSSVAEECDPVTVPYLTRAMAEVTLEQIRDELTHRGWKMTLS